MSYSSPPKVIKFNYITEDRPVKERTPSSHKRKRIFEGTDSSPKQFSPFKIIESNLHLSVNDQIHSTIERINRKLEKMHYLQQENQRLRQENFEINNGKGPGIENEALRRQSHQLDEELKMHRSRNEKARTLIARLKERSELIENSQLAELSDLFKL